MTKSAKDKFKAGDMKGACADAKAALAESPDDKKAFGISQLACRDVQNPKAELPKPEPPKSPQPPPTNAPAVDKDFLNTKVPAIGMSAPASKPNVVGPKSGPESVDDMLGRLATYKADGNYGGVLSTAGEVLKASPNNKEALNAKALAQNRLKDYKGALETAKKAIKDDPKNAVAHANKAFALGALGDREGMIAELKLAAELDPQFEAALQKAESADSASLFDMPGEVRESALQGTKAKEGGGSDLGMIKWIVIASLVLPLIGLVIFFVLRNTVLKTPPPKPGTPWPGALPAVKPDDRASGAPEGRA